MQPFRTMNRPTFTRRAALRGTALAGAATAVGMLPLRAGASQVSTPGATPESRGGVPLPDTAIGREFASLVAAINSHDPDIVLAHFEEYAPADRAEGMAAMTLLSTRAWGEVIVHRIDDATETRLTALLETTVSEEWLAVRVEHDGDRHSIDLTPAAPLPGTMPAGPLDDADLAAEMTRYVDKLADAGIFSGAVLIARNGAELIAEARGLADMATGERNAITTRFNLGSMNKMFTSVAIGQLVDGGEIAFTDTISKHLPDYPSEVAANVTIDHLLTHTSGLDDFFGPGYDQEKESLHTLEDYLPLFVDEPLRFEPGARHEYSNAGFIVLGLIIEAVTGQDYFDHMRERVYARAGMDATDAFERDATVPDRAIGYTVRLPMDPADLTIADALADPEPNDFFLAPRGTSAGGGYSTVGDLLRFDRALREATLASSDTVATLIEGKVDVPRPGVRYAYGFEDDRSGAERIVGHGGGAPGISGKLDMYWDLDATVVALGNHDFVAEAISMKANRLLQAG